MSECIGTEKTQSQQPSEIKDAFLVEGSSSAEKHQGRDEASLQACELALWLEGAWEGFPQAKQSSVQDEDVMGKLLVPGDQYPGYTSKERGNPLDERDSLCSLKSLHLTGEHKWTLLRQSRKENLECSSLFYPMKHNYLTFFFCCCYKIS